MTGNPVKCEEVPCNGLLSNRAFTYAHREEDSVVTAGSGGAIVRQASDPDVIVLSAEEEPNQANAPDPTPFATPDGSSDEGAVKEGVASRQQNPSSPWTVAGSRVVPEGSGSVRKRGHASEALCSSSEQGATRKRQRLGACDSSIPALVAAGWQGTGLQGTGEPCMALALDTWPGPEEPFSGSLERLAGLATDSYPALLQIECEVISVVSTPSLLRPGESDTICD